MAEDVAHGGRRDMGEFLCGRDYDGLDLGSQPAVRIGDGTFVFEVKHVPHATDYMADAKPAADFYGKSVVIDGPYSRDAGCSLAYDIQLLFGSEETAFVLVDTDCHHDLVEHGEGTLEYIQMPFGKRVE